MSQLRPIILCGGAGTRLWPLSREMYPKQFLQLDKTGLTMLQKTVLRLRHLSNVLPPVIICNEEHRFIAAEQLHQIEQFDAMILLEPEAKNTAPALALAMLVAEQEISGAVMLAMPADHLIYDEIAFCKSVTKAIPVAQQGSIVTFGIKPSAPEVGFGYIECAEVVDDAASGAMRVKHFHEKPDVETAEKYVSQKNYFWNAGIFMFTAQALQEEYKEHSPSVLSACVEAVRAPHKDLDFHRIDQQAFAQSPSISFDYAVMEHTTRGALIALESDWSDVGSWSSLWDVSDKDDFGNVLDGEVVAIDTRNSQIVAKTKVVTTLGLKDTIIVDTDDALLVAAKSEVHQLKTLVNALAESEKPQLAHHRKVYRPWGWYDSIDHGDGFQVKRIHVKPRAKLSVQRHKFRAEHWVVIAGRAIVRNGELETELERNQSTYIPIGVIHSLENPSDSEALEIIEVQTGSYLGEDDIERFEDQYGRS